MTINDAQDAIIAAGGGAGVSAIISWVIYTAMKRRIIQIDTIPELENRIHSIEIKMTDFDESKMAFVRMEEQIKHLTEKVSLLSDLLMRKVIQ